MTELPYYIIGMTLEDAETHLSIHQVYVRVIRKDGAKIQAFGTYRTDRVNVGVERGVVSEVVSIG